MLTIFKHKPCVLILLFLLSACSLLGFEEPTYIISSIKVVNGLNSEHKIAALVIDLINNDSRDISGLSFEFDVYDINGNQQPRIGANHVKSAISIEVLNGNQDTITVVLDSLFSRPPSDNLTVTRFCITEIRYSDGRIWRDTLRLFLHMASDVEVTTVGSGSI